MNENEIQITIGIPVYNVERYVERSLRSALDQDYSRPYNILVVDDCGTDTSMDIVRRVCEEHPHGNRVTIFRHDGNKGLGAARNTIIDHADGKYLFFLDSDDWITPDCLSKHYEVAEKYQAEFTCASYSTFLEETGQLVEGKQCRDGFWQHESVGAWLLSESGYPLSDTAWNKLYRSDFLRKYHIQTVHRIFEDTWMAFMTWLYASNVATISDHTLVYNIRSGSITSSVYGKKGTDQSAEICCDLVTRLRALIEKDFKDTYGVYDLYYRSINNTMDLLTSSVYTPEQRAYIDRQLYHACRKVPGLKYLHLPQNRFIYLCSLVFENTFSYCKYRAAYNWLSAKLHFKR